MISPPSSHAPPLASGPWLSLVAELLSRLLLPSIPLLAAPLSRLSSPSASRTVLLEGPPRSGKTWWLQSACGIVADVVPAARCVSLRGPVALRPPPPEREGGGGDAGEDAPTAADDSCMWRLCARHDDTAPAATTRKGAPSLGLFESSLEYFADLRGADETVRASRREGSPVLVVVDDFDLALLGGSGGAGGGAASAPPAAPLRSRALARCLEIWTCSACACVRPTLAGDRALEYSEPAGPPPAAVALISCTRADLCSAPVLVGPPAAANGGWRHLPRGASDAARSMMTAFDEALRSGVDDGATVMCATVQAALVDSGGRKLDGAAEREPFVLPKASMAPPRGDGRSGSEGPLSRGARKDLCPCLTCVTSIFTKTGLLSACIASLQPRSLSDWGSDSFSGKEDTRLARLESGTIGSSPASTTHRQDGTFLIAASFAIMPTIKRGDPLAGIHFGDKSTSPAYRQKENQSRPTSPADDTILAKKSVEALIDVSPAAISAPLVASAPAASLLAAAAEAIDVEAAAMSAPTSSPPESLLPPSHSAVAAEGATVANVIGSASLVAAVALLNERRRFRVDEFSWPSDLVGYESTRQNLVNEIIAPLWAWNHPRRPSDVVAPVTRRPPAVSAAEPAAARDERGSTFREAMEALRGAMEVLCVRPPVGVVIHGHTGSGKTALAKAIARAAGMRLIFAQCPRLLSKYFGDSEANIRSLFRAARAVAPCVLVLDEIDCIAAARGGAEGAGDIGGESATWSSSDSPASAVADDAGSSASSFATAFAPPAGQVLNAADQSSFAPPLQQPPPPSSFSVQDRMLATLLNELDGVGLHRGEGRAASTAGASPSSPPAPSGGVLVIGTTTRVHALDAAVLRPGRLERHVFVPLPDAADRAAIVRRLVAEAGVSRDDDEGLDEDALARAGEGQTPAALAGAVQGAITKCLQRWSGRAHESAALAGAPF